MKSRLYIIILFMLFLFQSCSLKEVRSDCPCWFTLDLSQPHSLSDRIDCLLIGQDGTTLMDKTFPLAEGSIVEQTVPRGVHTLIGLIGYQDTEHTGKYILKNGQISDTLWSHSTEVDCSGEFAKERVVVHRHFTNMTIINKTQTPGQTNLKSVRLETSCGGMDLISLKPFEGQWQIELPITPDGTSKVIIPRLDSKMKLNLILTTNDDNVAEYDLQESLREQGYDWSLCCLKDVIVSVDYVTSSITITIVPWQNGSHYEEII